MVKKSEDKFKYLVLDLDNTLIFCKKINTRKGVRRRFILRPHLFKFLNTLKQYYVLNIFTGRKREYAEKVFKKIKSRNYTFLNMLCFDHLKNGKKVLDEILKDHTRIILVDDNENYIENKENAIIVKPFYGEKDDKVLLKLEEILIGIHRFIDVTEGIKAYKNKIKKTNK